MLQSYDGAIERSRKDSSSPTPQYPNFASDNIPKKIGDVGWGIDKPKLQWD